MAANNKSLVAGKDKKKFVNTDAFKKILKLYILPIGSATIFLLIIILLIIPKISEIFASLDQVSILDSEYVSDQAKVAQLTAASSDADKLMAQLNVVNQTTPTGKTEVVAFRDKISTLIQNNGLDIIEERLSENDLTTATGTDSAPTTPTASGANNNLSLQEVPFSFEIKGQYDSLINFIKDLSTIDDFIIVREMNLTAVPGESPDGNVWDLKLTIDKYQFSTISLDAQNNLYLNIPIDATPSQNVLDYINSRIK